MRRPVAAKAGRPRSSPRHHHHHHQPPPPPPPQPRLARSAAPSPPLPPPRYQARRARRARCPVTQLHCRASRPSRPRRPAPPPACPPAAGGTSAGPGGRGPRRAVRAQRATRPTSGRRGCNMPPLPQRDAPRRSPTRHRAAPATLLAASSPPRSTHWAAEGSARPCALGDPAGRGDKEGGQGRAGRGRPGGRGLRRERRGLPREGWGLPRGHAHQQQSAGQWVVTGGQGWLLGAGVEAGLVIGVQGRLLGGKAGYWGTGLVIGGSGCRQGWLLGAAGVGDKAGVFIGAQRNEGHPPLSGTKRKFPHTAFYTPFISSRDGQGGAPNPTAPAPHLDSIELRGSAEGREMTSFVSFWLFLFFYRNTVCLCTDYLHSSPSLAYKSPAGKPKLFSSRIAMPARCRGRAGGMFSLAEDPEAGWRRKRRRPGATKPPERHTAGFSPRSAPFHQNPRGFEGADFPSLSLAGHGQCSPRAKFFSFVPQPEPRRSAEALA